MPLRLKFPRGSGFSFLRQFVRDGLAVDLTGATLAAFLKYSPDELDADAIAEPVVAVVDAATGLVRVTLAGADTAALPRAPEFFWQARATLSGGTILAPDAMQGPVMLQPFLALTTPEILPELTPDSAAVAGIAAAVNTIEIRPDLTSAALHRALATVGHVLPWLILVLGADGIWGVWTLRARVDGETDDTNNFRLPTDYHATTNKVIWVHSALN